MEANSNDSSSSQSQKTETEDRLSMLTDDVLLPILERVGPRMAARTSALSTRWRCLPWLLSELSINVKDFLSIPHPKPIRAKHVAEAMASLAKATTSFLVKRHKEFTISCLHLKVYLNKTLLYEVGPMVGDVINGGLLKDLDLNILHEKGIMDCSEEDMLRRAQEIDGFFSAYPSVPRCLTKLYIQNVGFDKLDMHYVLFDCCKQLKHLTLCQSDAGDKSLFKIDVPNSNLRVLELTQCRFETLEVACLPKLEKFHLDTWFYDYTPLAFGFVPSLGELELTCGAVCLDGELTLSKLVNGTTCIHTLTLDFKGENIWMQPEMKQLCRAFNKLRKLFVRGIFVQFGILWTLAFLAAAPSIEMLHIEVWEHVSNGGEVEDEYRRQINSERRTPKWEVDFDDTKNLILQELEFVGFRSLQQQFTFIRSVLQRSPNLHKIVLKGDEECDSCAAHGRPPSKFPKKDEQEMIMRRIQDGIFSPQIIFDEYSERRRRM